MVQRKVGVTILRQVNQPKEHLGTEVYTVLMDIDLTRIETTFFVLD